MSICLVIPETVGDRTLFMVMVVAGFCGLGGAHVI